MNNGNSTDIWWCFYMDWRWDILHGLDMADKAPRLCTRIIICTWY